jgi:hypothetical protein
MPFILQPRFKQGPHNPIFLIVKKKKFARARQRQLAYMWLISQQGIRLGAIGSGVQSEGRAWGH